MILIHEYCMHALSVTLFSSVRRFKSNHVNNRENEKSMFYTTGLKGLQIKITNNAI